VVFVETIKVESYKNLLSQFITLLEKNEWDGSFQHDGATAHSANSATALLYWMTPCCASPLATLISAPPTARLLWVFLKESLSE
jgi:hypothetical protein